MNLRLRADRCRLFPQSKLGARLKLTKFLMANGRYGHCQTHPNNVDVMMQFRKGFENIEQDFIKHFNFLEEYGFMFTKKCVEGHMIFFKYEDRKNNLVVHLLYEFMEQVFNFTIFNKNISFSSIPIWKKLMEIKPGLDRDDITPGMYDYQDALAEYVKAMKELFDLIFIDGRKDLIEDIL